jgi:hypothetical protein
LTQGSGRGTCCWKKRQQPGDIGIRCSYLVCLVSALGSNPGLGMLLGFNPSPNTPASAVVLPMPQGVAFVVQRRSEPGVPGASKQSIGICLTTRGAPLPSRWWLPDSPAPIPVAPLCYCGLPLGVDPLHRLQKVPHLWITSKHYPAPQRRRLPYNPPAIDGANCMGYIPMPWLVL